jgi:hypothetical protein
MLSHWRVPSFTAPTLSLSLISQREGKVKITGKALIFPFNIWVKFVFFSSNLPCFLSLISHLSNLPCQRWIADDSSIDLLDSPSWVMAFNRSHLDYQRGITSGLKIKAVIAKNWYCFFAIIFSFARSCNNENNVVDSYRMTSWHCSSVWTGLEGKQTEPKLICLNRFSVRFGSKKKKKRFGCLFWSKTGPNRKCSALCWIACYFGTLI